jgi:hypothetical protein
MLLDTPKLREELQPERDHLVYKERIVPSRQPRPHRCPYSLQYRWLFGFERRLAAKLSDWLPDCYEHLFGTGGLISEALSNAYCHGNRRNPDRPIWVRVYDGPFGLMVEIEDSGRGFDHERHTHQRSEANRTCSRDTGLGLRAMLKNAEFGVAYYRGGRVFRLVHLAGLDELQRRHLARTE